MTDDVLTIGEAAQIIKHSKSWLYKQIHKAKAGSDHLCPPYFRINKKIFFSKTDLLVWFLSHPNKHS